MEEGEGLSTTDQEKIRIEKGTASRERIKEELGFSKEDPQVVKAITKRVMDLQIAAIPEIQQTKSASEMGRVLDEKVYNTIQSEFGGKDSEGNDLSESAGFRAKKALLLRVAEKANDEIKLVLVRHGILSEGEETAKLFDSLKSARTGEEMGSILDQLLGTPELRQLGSKDELFTLARDTKIDELVHENQRRQTQPVENSN